MTARDERGSMAVLTIGLTLVVFAVAGLAIDGTQAFIARRSLQSAADGAAVAAAAQLDTSIYYRSGGSIVRLNTRRAESAAVRLLARRGIDATVRLRSDEDGIELGLVSEIRTTWLRLVGIEAIPVSATARAEPFPQDVSIRR